MRNKIKIAIVAGTRPEVIKLFPLLRELQGRSEFEAIWVSTGQHKEMLESLYKLFDFNPDFDLDLMTKNQDLGSLTSKILTSCSKLFLSISPDYVLVQGDTNTAFTAALAAYYQKIKIIHVEAGLRSHDLYAPFPEEGNRKLISAIAHINFTPTELSKENLIAENSKSESHNVGNTVLDSLMFTSKLVEQNSNSEKYQNISKLINKYQKMILITGHRRENFGHGLESICDALVFLAEKFPTNLFLYPVHMNPHVKQIVESKLDEISNVTLLPPMDYDEMVYTLKRAFLVITDSGGIQEEAPSFNIPILVTREKTERPEGIDSGCAKLVGTNMESIIYETSKLLSDADYYRSFSNKDNPYGDGKSSEKIADYIITSYFND